MSFVFRAGSNNEGEKKGFNFTPIIPSNDYLKNFQELKNEIIGMKKSINEVLEIKKCMNEIFEVKKNIDEVLDMKKSLNEISEIKKNIDDVLEMKQNINDIKNLLVNFINIKDNNKTNNDDKNKCTPSLSNQINDIDKSNKNNIDCISNDTKITSQNLDSYSKSTNNNDIIDANAEMEKSSRTIEKSKNENSNLENSKIDNNDDCVNIEVLSSDEDCNIINDSNNNVVESKSNDIEDNSKTVNDAEDQLNNIEINQSIEVIDEQEPIYDQRIKYIAKALKIDFFTNIDKCINVSCSTETKEKMKESLKKVFEIREYLFYLEAEKKDLINVIEMAYKMNYGDFKSFKKLTERLDTLNIKVNQIYKKCDTVKQSMNSDIYLKIEDINDNDIKNAESILESMINIDAKKKRKLNELNSFITEFIPYSNDKFYMEYQYQISYILTQLNRIRLMFVCPNASLLFKKDNSFKNITTYCINIPSQNTTESLLLGKYKDHIYDFEYHSNKYSFYLNKNSFYDNSYNVITLH